MTELYINARMVDLPADFSLTVTQENPFFTKNGSWSLDLDLSLLSANNAVIYRNINRVNSVDELPNDRAAILVVDGEVILHGTENILSWTEKAVKIKLVSGNSELNYLIGGDKSLRDLELGTADVSKYAPANLTTSPVRQITELLYSELNQPFPANNWLILPFYLASSDKIGNAYLPQRYSTSNPSLSNIYFDYVNTGWFKNISVWEKKVYENYRPQPYFCFILKKVIESLGYSLQYNGLAEDPYFKYFYIVNGYNTLEFAKMLPDWTVKEFLSKVEQQFNCSVVVDEWTKQVNIYFNHSPNLTNTIDLEVDDVYMQEYDQESDNKIVQNSNVAYNLDDSNEYHKYAALARETLKNAKESTFNSMNYLCTMVTNPDNAMRFKTIYRPADGSGVTDEVKSSGKFIAYKDENNNVYPKKVNQFAPIYNNPDSNEIDISLDIMPAPMAVLDLDLKVADGSVYFHSVGQFPVAVDGDDFTDTSEESTDDYSIQDLIDSESAAESIPSKIYLAVYDGLKSIINNYVPTMTLISDQYPMPWVENLGDFFKDPDSVRYMNPDKINPFRLDWMNTYLWQKTVAINTTKVYKFTIYTHGKIDVFAKFLIRGKWFRCKKIERTITERGFAPSCTGEFYPYEE